MSAASSVDLSVIIPAYNEVERLPRTLERIYEYLSGQPITYELIVVLDGPTDTTAAIVRSFAEGVSNLTVIERAINYGKGYSVREGMLAARGRIRLFADADNSTDIAHLAKVMDLFDAGCDVVIASRSLRDVKGAQQVVSQAWHKRLVGRLGNLWVQLLAVRGIWDTQCGFKAFRANVAEQIFARTTINRWAFDVEVLALARAMNYKIGILPAHWNNDARSHVRWADYFGVLRDTLIVRRNLWSDYYQLDRSQEKTHPLMSHQSPQPANGKSEDQK